MAHVPARPAVPGRPVLRLRRDPALRSLAARGDAQAFAVLYERHHQSLYRYCRSILGHDEDARDALQSTMTRALAALQGEQRDFEVRPWLFRIAHNEAISLLRRRLPSAELGEAAALSADGLPEAVEDRERLAHLRSDLRDLPDRQRAALVLRELNGLSHAEIAAVLECSPRSVKQTIFEARAALNDCAEGRAMLCSEVQQALSDGDGRVRRGRRMRAHMRSCRSCRCFDAALRHRPAELAALAPPLPAAASLGLLSQLITWGGQASVAGGGVAASTVTKAVLVVAATATVAGGGVTAGPNSTDRSRPSSPPGVADTTSAHPARPPAGPGTPIRARTGTATPTLDRRAARRPRPPQPAAVTAPRDPSASGVVAPDDGRATPTSPPEGARPVTAVARRHKPGASPVARERPAARGRAETHAGGHGSPREATPAKGRPAPSRTHAVDKAATSGPEAGAQHPVSNRPTPAAIPAADHRGRSAAGPAAMADRAGDDAPAAHRPPK